MQVLAPNNIKIYNLSAGKSLPQWLTEQKRRNLLKKNVDIRRRIELIEDFKMPDISTSIRVSKDGQYIFTTGIYKPRVKCYDTNNLALKFERCFDAEVVTFEVISDDYSKLIFLQSDRYIEIHSKGGKYYKLRVPRHGRDLKYHYPSCDTFIVGDSKEIYRLNLERGQFLQSFVTEASAINKCEINPLHHLLVVGTQEGKVEAWDPRMKNNVGILDCAFHSIIRDKKETVPQVTALKFQGGLNLGVGMSTGQILLYDIRSNKPFMVRDHMYDLPIKNIEFHEKMDLIYSMDNKIVKIWEKNSGKLYTSIQAESDFNDFCVIPNTGMLMMANESTKMQTYYIPTLGPAPYWCSFLDNLTEELEELNYDTVYDDYKFVTEQELEDLGLLHLKGSDLLRAYMHGYFMNVRLYRKMKDAMQPFETKRYKNKQIQDKLEKDSKSSDKIPTQQAQELPSMNQELALKLMENTNSKNRKKQTSSSLLTDERFKALFHNSDLKVDTYSEEYTVLNPIISHLHEKKTKQEKRQLSQKEKEDKEEEEVYESNEDEARGDNSDEDFVHDNSDSSDDEKPWVKEVQRNYRLLRQKEREEREDSSGDEDSNPAAENQSRLNEIKNVKFEQGKSTLNRINKVPFAERLKKEEAQDRVIGSRGSREMTFTIGKRKRQEVVRRHDKEHKHLLRPAGNIFKKKH